jgi:16S rRNA (guanine(966)-N(2))-methyltransferase RsmD
MGFEAISRGCDYAVLVDNSSVSIKLINSNVEKLEINDKVNLVNTNVIKYLKSTRIFESDCVIFYFDPPYREKKLYKVVLSLLERYRFEKDAIIAVEHLNEFILPAVNSFSLWKTKKYGDKSLTLFARFN